MPAVFVFVQEGCSHCHDFMPKFSRAVAPYRTSFPIGVYDLAKDGRHANFFASQMKVEATPTMIVLDRRGNIRRYQGTMGVREIEKALDRAVA